MRLFGFREEALRAGENCFVGQGNWLAVSRRLVGFDQRINGRDTS